MTFELEGESRWDGVRAVLSPEFLAEFDSQARLGATLFSSEKGYEGGECPLLERTPPALSNSASIVQLMVDNEPIDDTPTAETIQIVAQDLVELRQSEPELHPAPAIVFVTDGTPDTCDQPEPNEGEAEAVAAAQAAHEAGVPTFIIGLSEEAEGPYFQQMANVGAGLSATFGNAEFFFAVDRTSLRDAYEAALLRTRSCRYSLEGQGTNALQVSLDGEQLDPDAEWQLVDSTTIQLLGPACATVRRTKTYDLEASCDDPR